MICQGFVGAKLQCRANTLVQTSFVGGYPKVGDVNPLKKQITIVVVSNFDPLPKQSRNKSIKTHN